MADRTDGTCSCHGHGGHDGTHPGEGGPDRGALRAVLREVPAPEAGTGADVLAAGVVTGLSVHGGTVEVRTDTTGLDPERAEETTERVRRALLGVPGVEAVRLAGESPATPDEGIALPGVGAVLAVASAKGGVGKTTVATGLARALSEAGLDVGLFDADLYGPNVPEALDVEGPVAADEEGRAVPVERDGIEVMSVGLVSDGGPLAWRGAMAHDALTELLGDTAWTDRDVLVLDLPPGTGDVVLTTLGSVPVDGAVLVTTPAPTALADTRRSADLFAEHGVPVFGSVVNMAGVACPDCGSVHDLFDGDVGDLDVPVLAELPFDPGMRSTAATPEPLRDLGERVHEELDGSVEVPDHALDLRGVPPAMRAEQARIEFRAADPGRFHVLTDRDPRPLASALADAVDADPAALDPTVERQSHDEWAMAVERPGGDGA